VKLLPQPKVTAERLEHGAARRAAVELLLQGALEAVSAHGEEVKASSGHGSATEGFDHVATE
jgi:hypothetical protein